MVQQTRSNASQLQEPVMPAQQPVKQPVVAQPAEQMQPVTESSSIWKKWWLWVIIAVVIIGVGTGIYFLFRG